MANISYLVARKTGRPSTEITASATLALTAVGNAIRINHASNAITATIPLNATVAFSLDTEIQLIRMGAGVAGIACVNGVTINGAAYTTTYIIKTRYNQVMLKKIATDAWILYGDFEVVV